MQKVMVWPNMTASVRHYGTMAVARRTPADPINLLKMLSANPAMVYIFHGAKKAVPIFPFLAPEALLLSGLTSSPFNRNTAKAAIFNRISTFCDGYHQPSGHLVPVSQCSGLVVLP